MEIRSDLMTNNEKKFLQWLHFWIFHNLYVLNIETFRLFLLLAIKSKVTFCIKFDLIIKIWAKFDFDVWKGNIANIQII